MSADVRKQVLTRFPEVPIGVETNDPSDGFGVMMDLAEGLKAFRVGDITPQLIERVAEFARWCRAQPPGRDATDDVFTMFIGGFVEMLFEAEGTRSILPHIIPREDLLKNRAVLEHWVGSAEFEAALAAYDRVAQPCTAANAG